MTYPSLTVTTTRGFLAMAEDSMGRDRFCNPIGLEGVIDKEGVHLLAMKFVHNDIEWRTLWFVKTVGKMRPLEIWMDVAFDSIYSLTKEVNVDESNLGDIDDNVSKYYTERGMLEGVTI